MCFSSVLIGLKLNVLEEKVWRLQASQRDDKGHMETRDIPNDLKDTTDTNRKRQNEP